MEAAGPDGQPPDVAVAADGPNAVAHVLAAPVAEGMAAPIAQGMAAPDGGLSTPVVEGMAAPDGGLSAPAGGLAVTDMVD